LCWLAGVTLSLAIAPTLKQKPISSPKISACILWIKSRWIDQVEGYDWTIKKNSVCFGVSELFRNQPKQKIGVSKQTELNINTL
jgi:hypothetical protein